MRIELQCVFLLHVRPPTNLPSPRKAGGGVWATPLPDPLPNMTSPIRPVRRESKSSDARAKSGNLGALKAPGR